MYSTPLAWYQLHWTIFLTVSVCVKCDLFSKEMFMFDIDLVGVASKLFGRSRRGVKRSFPPHWKSMALTQNGLHKIISASRQSKIRQKTEPYWVGLSVRYLWLAKRPNRMVRGVLSPHFLLPDGVSGKRLGTHYPEEFSYNPNQTHLKRPIKLLKTAWKLQAGVLKPVANKLSRAVSETVPYPLYSALYRVSAIL